MTVESNLDEVADHARKRAFLNLLLVVVFLVNGFVEFLEGGLAAMLIGAVWVAMGIVWLWVASQDFEQERLLREQHEHLENLEANVSPMVSVVELKEDPRNGA